MPDKDKDKDKSRPSGWRMKIHARPGALRLPSFDGHKTVEEPAESPHPPEKSSWEKPREKSTWWGHHGRPGSPKKETVSAAPFLECLPTDRLAPDSPTLRAPSTPNPRRGSNTSFAKYLAAYLSSKDSKDKDKGIKFDTPWDEIPPLSSVPVVDPLVTAQGLYAYMQVNPPRPIPTNYYCGLFQVFDSYRDLREDNDKIKDLLESSLDAYDNLQKSWKETEDKYQTEIRRLELIIARGTSGIDGLLKARQGSVVKRKRTHKKTISHDEVPTPAELVPLDQLDEEIRLRSENVLMNRPVSPYSKMAALSKYLNSKGNVDVLVGTPPALNQPLSRKVQSDFDLMNLGKNSEGPSSPGSDDSDFSDNGDALPDEECAALNATVEMDAMVALQELGLLIARKKRIDTDKFLTGLMKLYVEEENISRAESTSSRSGPAEELGTSPLHAECALYEQSEASFGSAPRARRHFSFEPGDDQMAALGEDIRLHEASGSCSSSSSSEGLQLVYEGQRNASLRTVSAENKKASKIPSPIQGPKLGSIRREGSHSSMHSPLWKYANDGRRTSQSSILTAVRDVSGSGSQQSVSQSISSSVRAYRSAESHQSDTSGGVEARNDTAVLAATRAVGHAAHSRQSSTAQGNAGGPAGESHARAGGRYSQQDRTQ